MFDTFEEDRDRQGKKTDERHEFTNDPHYESKKISMNTSPVLPYLGLDRRFAEMYT